MRGEVRGLGMRGKSADALKPLDRLQSMITLRLLGKNKWIKAHWRYDD